MAQESSFDVVSEFDRQELINALDQVKREVGNRFDLKDANTEFDLAETLITITTSDETRLKNVILILEEKLAKRGLSPHLLDSQSKPVETALGGRVRQELPLRKGIDQPLAKKIVGEIKSAKLKVQASIQGEQVRVSGKTKDDLQAVIALLKEKGNQWNAPLQFTNYR